MFICLCLGERHVSKAKPNLRPRPVLDRSGGTLVNLVTSYGGTMGLLWRTSRRSKLSFQTGFVSLCHGERHCSKAKPNPRPQTVLDRDGSAFLYMKIC